MKHDFRFTLLTSALLAGLFALPAAAQSGQGSGGQNKPHKAGGAQSGQKPGGEKKPAPAQAGGGEKKPAPAGEKPQAGDASSKKAPAAPAMAIPVTGATADNAAKAGKDLQAVTHTKQNWVCAACGTSQATKGQCPKCKKDLVAQGTTVNAFRDAKIDPATGKLTVTLGTGQSTSLSEIDRALKPDGITLDQRKVPVGNFSKLIITAPADAKDAATAVQKALDDSKLFTHATAHYDEAKKEYVAIVEGVTGTPTFGDVGGAIEKAGTGYKLADMAWTAPCESCAKAGMTQAGCKNCWGSEAAHG